jgi:peptidoglycan/xylan/chitin deacetylase (PgdA/CDA1 family)
VALVRHTVKAVAAAADLLHRPPPGLVVLVYHRVGQKAAIQIDLPLSLFEEQIAFLVSHERVVTLTDALDRVTIADGPKQRLVAVTFDDGTADFSERALSVLVEHQVPVTLYVATDFVESGRSFPHDGRPLSWAAIRDAVATGLVEVGSHTHRHALLDRLPPAHVADELSRSVELIADRVGMAPSHFAYPKAVPGSPSAEKAVRSHFASAALAGTRVNRYGATDRYRLARSPIQTSDGMRWFRSKVAGGLALEDSLRRRINGRRYATATS